MSHPSVSLGSHMHGKGLIRLVKVDRGSGSENQRSKHFAIESRLYGNAVAVSYEIPFVILCVVITSNHRSRLS